MRKLKILRKEWFFEPFFGEKFEWFSFLMVFIVFVNDEGLWITGCLLFGECENFLATFVWGELNIRWVLSKVVPTLLSGRRSNNNS